MNEINMYLGLGTSITLQSSWWDSSNFVFLMYLLCTWVTTLRVAISVF